MNALADRVSNILESLLKGSPLKIDYPPKNSDPLFLLLDTEQDLVGFASLDGKPEEDFSRASLALKSLYSMHSKEWVDHDLSLVLCKTGSGEISGEFCTKVEMDPYFCRKFVIDSNNLKTELERLPFVPLRPESILEHAELVTAITFLTTHGVTSKLAGELTVPYARGIGRIIEDCIQGRSGEPKWQRAETIVQRSSMRKSISTAGPSVRLKKLVISNFRAYYGSHEFDLDSNLIVLFGANGLGKTSFFDALDFACTGGVARFDRRFGRGRNRLTQVLRHLDSSEDDCFVQARILKDNEEILLERRMQDITHAYLRGNPTDRKTVLKELSRIPEEILDLRVENLVRLFRSPHLFGQEFQSLTSDLRDDSKLPDDTVSRMVALQDYVEAIGKTQRILEELEKKSKERKLAISSLEASLESEKAEIEQLSRSARVLEQPSNVSEVSEELAKRIRSMEDPAVEIPKEFNIETCREWRSRIAVRKNQVAQELEALKELASKLPELGKHRKELEDRLSNLRHNQDHLKQIDEAYSEQKKNMEQSEQKLRRMLAEEGNLSLRKENLDWLVRAKANYEKMRNQLAERVENRRKSQSKLLELLPRIEVLRSDSEMSKQKLRVIASQTENLKNTLKGLRNLRNDVDDWLKVLDRQKSLSTQLQNLERKIANAQSVLKTKRDELSTAIGNQKSLAKHLDSLQESRSELKILLDSIEKHIVDNVCPVCGIAHKSREEIIERLGIQRGLQPQEIRAAEKLLRDAEAKTKELNKTVSNLELELEQLRQQVVERQSELSDVVEDVNTYEERALMLDFPLPPESPKAVIDARIEDILQGIGTNEQALTEQRALVEKQQNQLSILVNDKERYEKDMRTAKSEEDQLRSLLNEMRDNTSDRGVSLESKDEEIECDMIEVKTRIEDLHKKITTNQTENQNLRKKADALRESRDELKEAVRILNETITNSRKYVEEVENLLRGLDMDLSADTDQVVALKEKLAKRASILESLQNDIINLEIALDASEVSAALAKAQQQMEHIEKQILNEQREQDKLEEWLSYFDDIHKELGSARDRRLTEYIEEYGPLASNIQERLRPVYGFGDMKLVTRKGEILVQVQRGQRTDLSPSDCFSESQIQIAMLSIFLSAALTQTWSSFAPILLDDPVTHFDDLNAYCLLDLIRGLINEPSEERQFIISTCEERLFQLMRHKFRKLSDRVIFYKFESIGENGPVYDRVI